MKRSVIRAAIGRAVLVGRLAFLAVVATSPWFSRVVAKEALTADGVRPGTVGATWVGGRRGQHGARPRGRGLRTSIARYIPFAAARFEQLGAETTSLPSWEERPILRGAGHGESRDRSCRFRSHGWGVRPGERR